MPDSKTLLKSTLVYTIGNFGSKILSFLLIPLYSYFLTKSELGVYDIIISSVQLMLPIVSLQMNEAVYRWLLECGNDLDKKRNVLKQTFLIMGITFLVVETCVLILSHYYVIPYLKEFSLLLFTSTLLPFFQQITRGVGKPKVYSLAGILNSFIIFCCSTLFLFTPWFSDKVQGIFYSLIVANSLTIIFLFISLSNYLKRVLSISTDIKLQKSLIKYSFPLVLNSLSWWLINASDRYIILEFLGIEDNGIYAVAARLPSLLTIINTVFMLAWQDMVMSNENTSNPLYSKIFNTFISFNMGITLILISASPLVSYILFDEVFFDAWKFAPLLYLGSCFSSLSGFLGALYMKSKMTRGILVTSIIGATINILITLCLIKELGLYACGLGTFVSFLVMFIMRYKETLVMVSLDLDIKKFLLHLGVSLLSLIILIYYQNFLVSIFLTVFALIYFLISNLNNIRSIFSKLNLKK